MSKLISNINETLEVIRKHTSEKYPVGIILGTGLGGLVKDINITHQIDYENLPHFPISTVESHRGKLIFGTINGKNVVAMQGRFHFYEGYSMQQITYPVRVMKFLGVETLLVSNACGGMNPQYRKGDVMIMVDHINMLGDNPLIGKNEDEFGPRFPDMSEPYSFELIELAEKIALENQLKIQKGVYVAVPGPNLETKAEYRFLRATGADVVGMSTIPENIVANHMGMKVLGISIITDECFPDSLKPVNVEEIIAAAMKAEPKMTLIMKELIKRLK
ncbi:MAG: purine-nucleoside phosphorylase [Ignavibacteriota bacterium]|nr:MAG: purine-nucleoside phosphorylase [Chlorobiota bacterium]MBE7476252.1 purine-nucleoside phosphorylase [Ignavibacteriales bacterium]MBL1124026.1 purine-nucleoside phosphorylase [Ignavibacteriota bacterium]MCC7094276.1 purine-nucleoside phosphorylase [Ignavibacteriaceae bacterium]MCE7856442.1 purine-nucleoside phosphorylase [Ignavibacteria bacterium CHB3]MEB2297613.1 purine-nucleoside phosphorylase [Ignavibacteria bacterium]